ncbi:hypothetical protein [Phenylobacterium sp.]|jgi:hypothetical protein|uniref:hypothetical protein n=1 Tax=Phenylobacterium sp. TaxID=1871053 RepID=UPI002F42DEF7
MTIWATHAIFVDAWLSAERGIQVNASTIYKVRVSFEAREDGGLRVWSDDLPELVLSHANADKVIADIPRAMEVILSERLGAKVRVEELASLPPYGVPAGIVEDRRQVPMSREFAALAA